MNRIVVLAAVCLPVLAGVIRVPSQQPTIQAGLNAAQSGDTVLVAPDTWRELLTWPSRDGITLLSEAGPESTRVDAEKTGLCLNMTSGSLTRATVVEGFTFASGLDSTGGAAGIRCGGSAVIRRNRITNCQGVGLYLYSTSSSFAPLVWGNEIDGCTKEIPNYNYGAGVYLDAPDAARPELWFNHIHHDTLRNSSRNYGGGIYCEANALIIGNVIEANVLVSDTGVACRAYGAGIFVDMNCAPLIFSNLIINNRCATDAWKYGAGIRNYLGARPLIVGNTIAGNVCEGPHMWSNGGGIYNDMRCTTTVKLNIIANNQATSGSGVYNYTTTQNGEIVSSYNDYWNNSLSGCTMGPGDIGQDPLFVSGESRAYFLSQTAAGQPANSPCVDAGDTLLSAMGVKLDSLLRAWTTRTDSVFDQDELDIGYHYPCGVPTAVAEPAEPRSGARSLTAVPSVFSKLTAFRAGPHSRISVFDPAGRRVASLRADGRGEATWDGAGVGPGVYVARAAGVGPATVLKLR